MYDINVVAVRSNGVVMVTVSGMLQNSCHTAKIKDHYPGGNIVYVKDPGEAQVFIEETVKPDSEYCSLSLVPWSETIKFADEHHDTVGIYYAYNEKIMEVEVIDINKIQEKPSFIVISLVGLNLGDLTGSYYKGCSILPEGSMYPMIYRQVFGPDTMDNCRRFVESNCGNKQNRLKNGCGLALNAVANLKEQPNGLYVHGSMMVYTKETTVTLTKAEPQGLNSSILLLDLTITENPGPMKGIPRAFHYEEHGSHIETYRQVQVVVNKKESCTIDVIAHG